MRKFIYGIKVILCFIIIGTFSLGLVQFGRTIGEVKVVYVQGESTPVKCQQEAMLTEAKYPVLVPLAAKNLEAPTAWKSLERVLPTKAKSVKSKAKTK